MLNHLKEKALILRREGYSFREIGNFLGIAKSTASLWTRSVILDSFAVAKIKKLCDKGRAASIESNKRKRELIWQEISINCSVLRDGQEYGLNEYKIFLALLYWGEGNKADGKLCFTNSDPKMIILYLSLLRRSFSVDNNLFRVWLHLHEYHNREESLRFWSKLTGICKKQFSVYNTAYRG